MTFTMGLLATERCPVSKQHGPIPGVATPSPPELVAAGVRMLGGGGWQVPGYLVPLFSGGTGAASRARDWGLGVRVTHSEPVWPRASHRTGPRAELCPLTCQAAHEAPGQGVDRVEAHSALPRWRPCPWTGQPQPPGPWVPPPAGQSYLVCTQRTCVDVGVGGRGRFHGKQGPSREEELGLCGPASTRDGFRGRWRPTQQGLVARTTLK